MSNDKKPISKEEQAARAANMQAVKADLTARWSEAYLDAEAIWNAKMKASSDQRVIDLAGHINAGGRCYAVKNFREVRALYGHVYVNPDLTMWHVREAIKMAMLSGCEMDKSIVITSDGAVPRAGSHWEFVNP